MGGRPLTNAREVDLAAYLRGLGFVLEAKAKGNWRVAGCDGLTIRGNHWRQFRVGGRGRVGNSLDFVITLLGLDPNSAVRDLLDHHGPSASASALGDPE